MKYIYCFFKLIRQIEIKCRENYYKSILDIHPSVRIGKVEIDKANVSIGEGTYIRSGEISSGKASIKIGCFCAIGSNVSIRARTHDFKAPTASKSLAVNKRYYADVVIGDHVWIGNNVYIKEGVIVADYAIIGANSVVTTDVPKNAIFAGVPAKLIRYNDDLECSHYK